MKRSKLIASAIAAVFMLALTGCDLTIRNKIKLPQPDFETVTVAFAGEGNTFNISSVKLNDEEIDDYVDYELTPTAWDSFGEVEVELSDGDTATFTFKQKNVTNDAWTTWALAFTDKTGYYGNFLRADTWINPATPWKNGGAWSKGGCAANMTYLNDYDYKKVGCSLISTDVVVLTVSLNKGVVNYSATINGKDALSGSSKDWADKLVWDN